MKHTLRLFIAIVIVIILATRFDLYSPEFLTRRDFLSADWGSRKEEKQQRGAQSGHAKPDVFNTCSPESFDDCAKVAMPHLSRY
jgi:hypothetical protein